MWRRFVSRVLGARGVTLVELLAVVALIGVLLGVGIAWMAARPRMVKPLLVEVEELFRSLRLGECIAFEMGRVQVYRRTWIPGTRSQTPRIAMRRRVLREIRFPPDAVRVVPAGIREMCAAEGMLVQPSGRPLGTRVCVEPQSGASTRVATGPPVCISPVGPTVYRTQRTPGGKP